jgi:glucose-6-phosphate isomerase
MNYIGKKRSIEKIKPEIQTIKQALKKKYETGYGFINTLSDKKSLQETITLAKKYTSLKNIVIIGIGGSNLGVKAILEATYGPHMPKKIFFADTVDSAATIDIYEEVQKNISETLCIIISKSGDTLETIAQTETFLGFKNMKYVVITEKNSPLWKYADLNQIPALEIPITVGGRYSVFSPVGLFPLAVLGYNLRQLIKGAERGKKRALSSWNNSAAQSALQIYANKDKTIIETMMFSTYFESLGKWYRQLFAESLGKQHNRAGKEIWNGITPTIAIGTTDLHSMGQLYLGGPRNKQFTFIIPKETKTIRIHSKTNIIPYINKKSFKHISNSIFYGLEKSFVKNKIPFNIFEIKRHPYDIGEFLMTKMFEVLFLAYLMDVNPFNQPNVEQYKEIARRTLK